MWRHLRTKIPFVARRTPVATPSPDIVYLHRARVRKPRLKNFLATCVVAYISWSLLSAFVLRPRLVRIAEVLDKLADGENEEEVEEDGDWYIPLPWFKQVSPKPYSAGSKEWRAMVKFSQNNEENRRMRLGIIRDLAEIVRKEAAANPGIASQFGKVLDKQPPTSVYMNVPAYPPPTVHQLCLVPFSSDGGPLFRTRRSDRRTRDRVMRAFVPIATGMASWASLRTIWDHSIEKARAVVSHDGDAVDAAQNAAPVRIAVLPKQAQASSDKQQPGTKVAPPGGKSKAEPDAGTNGRSDSLSGTPAPKDAKSDGPASSRAVGLGSQKQRQNLEHESGQQQQQPTKSPIDKDEALGPSWTPPEFLLHTVRESRQSFHRELGRRWKLGPNLPPPGCVELLGTVHIETERVWLRADVTAYYDLTTRQIDDESLVIRLRSVGPKYALRR